VIGIAARVSVGAVSVEGASEAAAIGEAGTVAAAMATVAAAMATVAAAMATVVAAMATVVAAMATVVAGLAAEATTATP
jgi:hypothetical protein